MRLRRALPCLLAAVAAGCGGGGSGGGDAAARTVALPAGIHAPQVLGLTVRPGDHALFAATDQGLLRIPPGGRRAVHVVRHLTGYGPPIRLRDDSPATFSGRELLGSGHPAPKVSPAPENLGLLVSSDDGGTWATVGLEGTDLHLLQVHGSRLWAYDFVKQDLVHTTDYGRTFRTVKPPGLISDLAVDPRDDRHVIVITDRGILQTRDAGRTWRPTGLGDAAHLLWAPSGALYTVDSAGSVRVSRDGGTSSSPAGRLGGRPAGPLAADGSVLWAPVAGGRFVRSRDGGKTWTAVLRLGS